MLTTVWFLCAVIIACYIPASVILKRFFSQHTFFEKFIIYTTLGLIFWAYQGMIFGYLGMRWLSYIYLLVFFIAWRPRQLLSFRRPFIHVRLDIILFLIFVFGIFGQVNRFIPTGFIFPKGIHIFTAASDDAFWHAALTNQLVRRFPPNEPGLNGVRVYNYHYWSNLVNAEFVRVFRLPLLTTQFIYSSILLSFLLGGLAFVLSRTLHFSKFGIYIAVYLQYFASDVIYLISFITTRRFEFGVHPLEDGTMFFENPPRAFSFVAVLLGVILLLKYIKTKQILLGLLISLVFGSIIGFKVHTGIMILGAVAGLSMFSFLKRDWKTAFFCFLTVGIALLVYFPVNSKSGLPVFVPFEMTRMFAVQDKLHLSFLELRRRVYAESFNFFGSLRMDIVMFIIFLVAQFGIRNLGWLGLKKSFSVLGKPIFVFLISGILLATLFGTLFIQPVAGADIFNSYLAASLFLWIFTIIVINHWITSRYSIIKIFLIAVIAVVTIPRWIYKTSFDDRLSSAYKPFILTSELTAMRFMQDHTKQSSVILVFNAGTWDSMFPYVSIFTNRDMFLSGQTILARHGIPFSKRTDTVEKIVSGDNPEITETLLKENAIDFLYFYGNPKLSKGLSGQHVKKIFQNDTNTIYQYVF